MDKKSYIKILKSIKKTYDEISYPSKTDTNLYKAIVSHVLRQYSNKIRPIYISTNAQSLIDEINKNKKTKKCWIPRNHGQLNSRNRLLRELGIERPKALNLDHLIEISTSTEKILNNKNVNIEAVLDESALLALITQAEHKSVKNKKKGWEKAYISAKIEYKEIRYEN